jgi:hypothetical protein
VGLVEGFIHPLLAWGAALAAVPLLIHLLNRRRHRPLSWAAMRFVQAAYRKTRRRVQLENLLLLFLRMAAVALLALALARPFTGRESPLAPLTERRRDVVLLLDGSASTGFRETVESVHEAILERARDLLGELDGTRGDRVRLLHAAGAVRQLSASSPEDALAALSTLAAPRDERLDLEGALAELLVLAQEDAGTSGRSALEVRLLTDLQRNTFLPAFLGPAEGAAAEPAASALVAGNPAGGMAGILDRLSELGVELLVEDLGPGTRVPANTGVEALEPLADILGPGLPVEIGVRVRNFGAGGRSGLRVALSVDGVRQPSQKIDLAAGSSAQVVFPVVFKEAGFHALVAELEGDRLAVDDARASVVFVPRTLSVLLVDGDPHDEIERDEVGYLRALLEPPDDGGLIAAPGGRYSPFACEVITASAFGPEVELASFDALVLANPSSLSAQAVERLEAWVARGGALLVTLGDRSSDPSALSGLNARLWRADGSGLLPARLAGHVAVGSRRSACFRAAWFEDTHPALSFFADERWRAYLTEIPVYEFVACEVTGEPGASGTRVLARLDDEQRSPLLLERTYDRGRVFLWTTSIDKDWNRFPDTPATMIPLVHELLRYAGTGRVPVRNAPVGATLELEQDSFPRGAMVVRPDGSRRPLDGEPSELTEGLWRLPAVGPADSAGLWRVESESPVPLHFAIQLDPAEGALERVAPEELEASHRAWRLQRPDSGEESEREEPERGELWRWLAGTTLLTLILETLWAAWIGRGRRLS